MWETEDQCLLAALRENLELRELGCRAELGQAYGVLVHVGDNALGLWSFHQGSYRFRMLASWEPFCEAVTPDDVVAITAVLANR